MSHYSPIAAALVTLLVIAIILFSKFSSKIQDTPNPDEPEPNRKNSLSR